MPFTILRSSDDINDIIMSSNPSAQHMVVIFAFLTFLSHGYLAHLSDYQAYDNWFCKYSVQLWFTTAESVLVRCIP